MKTGSAMYPGLKKVRWAKILAPQPNLSRYILLTLLYLVATLQAQPRHYTVSWLGLPVVDVTVETSSDDSTRQGYYQARTRPWFDKLYSIDNHYWITVDTLSGQPVRYRKQITERGNEREFHTNYRFDIGKVLYANGAERSLEAGDQELFSSLLWVEDHQWELGEQLTMTVEVEGIFWQVFVICEDIRHDEVSDVHIARVLVRFEGQLRGEAVLSRTDRLTSMLPGPGNELRLELDLENRQVLALEFGSLPFLVRARVNPGN